MTRPEPPGASLLAKMAAAPSLLLCLDYDGTLVSIRPHPSQASLAFSTKRLLRQLARQPGVSVALISGRSLRDLRRMVGVKSLWYVGNHGLELQGGGLRYVNPAARTQRPLLQRLARRFATSLTSIPGAWIEAKGLTLSLHWRAVPKAAQQRFHVTVRQVAAPHLKRHDIQVTAGKRVIEIRPSISWGKEDSITWLRRRLTAAHPSRRPVLVYAGDDQTDEAAFRVVNRSRGLSIFVGPASDATTARWRLRNPREVRKMLARILHTRWNNQRTS